MEGERGVDVKFISPTPGHVIKTVQNGDTKCFVNICYSNTIDTATCTKSPQNKGQLLQKYATFITCLLRLIYVTVRLIVVHLLCKP